MKALAYAAIVAVLVCSSATASAAFVDQDLNVIGDNLLTLDTSTNIQWLDINATSRLTFQDIEQGAGGWASQGFRAATRSELHQLFTNAGVAVGAPRSFSNTAGVETLIAHLGCNLCRLGSNLRGGSVLFGDDALSSQGLLGHATFTVDVYGMGFASVNDTWRSAWDLGSPNLTTILVRSTTVSPVPEPSMPLLWGAGILLLAALKRSRRSGTSTDPMRHQAA